MAIKRTGVELVAEGEAQFNAALKRADQSVKSFGDGVKRASENVNIAGNNLSKAAAKIDAVGRNTRIGFSAAAQAANLFGVNISGVVGPAGQAADAIGDIAGAVGSLGLAGGVLGALAVGLALVKNNYDEFIAKRAEAISQSDPWIQSIQREGQATAEVATAVERYAKALAEADAAQGRGGGRAADAMAKSAAYMRGEVDKAAEALWRLTAATAAVGEKLKELNAEAHANVGMNYKEVEAQRQYNLYLDNFTDIQDEALAGMVAVREEGGKKSDPKILEDYKKREAALKSLGNTASMVAGKLSDLVDSAMNFTSVTDEDMVASAAGTYTDKWDEFLRRAKAVQSGTDPAQFGDEFKKQLEGLNMPLDEVIRKFQNFQLFVGGANFDLVKFDAFTAQIEDQLLGVAGKAALTQEAMTKVWEKLSPTAKAALATTGIENAEDALKQFLDPASQAKDQVTDLNKEISNTPTLVTTTFDVVKAPTFDPVLAQIAEDLSIIPSAADILVTIYYESRNKPPDTGGTLGDGSAVPPGYASGGAGVFGTDQLVRVHAGEGFWFSGTQWQYPIPGAFGRMVEPAAPSSVRYGDSSANINVTVNANRVASSVDVDHLANRVAESIRSQVMTRRRAGA